MLTPEQLKIIPDGMVGLYQDLEAFVIKDFARRVAKAGKITASAEWQALRVKEIGAALSELEKEIKRVTELSQDEIDALMKGVTKLSLQNDAPLYEQMGKQAPNFEKSETLRNYVKAATEQTKGELFNMSQSLGFARKVGNKVEYLPMFEFYNKALDLAQFQVSTGVLDYNTATRNAVKRIAQSGLRWVDYESGWHNRVDVAARRAVMTGVNQMSSKMNDQVAKDLDADYVEVTAHSGARPDHTEWQGKVFKIHGSAKGYPNLAATTGLGTVTGLCGANCRHNYYAFFPGISVRTYTDKELQNIDPEPFEYEGKTYSHYEATQKQRQIETAMRQSKNELIGYDAIGDKQAFTTIGIKLQRQKQFYKEFSKKADLPLQNERHQVLGFGRSISQKSVDKVISSGRIVLSKEDFIKMPFENLSAFKSSVSNILVRKWYIYQNNQIPELLDKTKSIERQARQAFNLRNRNRTQARELMSDLEERARLDRDDPNITFEELIKKKMTHKNISKEDAIKDIHKTATKTNKVVNKSLGLE